MLEKKDWKYVGLKQNFQNSGSINTVGVNESDRNVKLENKFINNVKHFKCLA